MHQEIERKYAVKFIPWHIPIEKIVKMEQSFIYHDDITVVRIRKIEPIYGKGQKETKYIYTVKTKGDIEDSKKTDIAQRYEIENDITEEQYQELYKKRIRRTIEKTRINIPIYGKIKAEVDIYHGYLHNFLTVEVEFSNKEEAEKFRKPNWFGEELGFGDLSNRKLSEMTPTQFHRRITRERRKENEKIIQNFMQRPEFQGKNSNNYRKQSSKTLHKNKKYQNRNGKSNYHFPKKSSY